MTRAPDVGSREAAEGLVPDVILITGAMAAGKSTVAELCAGRLARSVHLRGDVFRRMIVRGRADPTPEMRPEAARQLHLRYVLAARAAAAYAAAGFTVVYQDVVLGPALGEVVELLAPLSLAVVVLCPDAEVLRAREAGRVKTGYGSGWTVEALDALVRDGTPRLGMWLDTSAMSAAEAADTILARLADARVR